MGGVEIKFLICSRRDQRPIGVRTEGVLAQGCNLKGRQSHTFEKKKPGTKTPSNRNAGEVERQCQVFAPARKNRRYEAEKHGRS